MPSRSSLKLNIAANYAGQFYVAVVSILLLPLQVRLLGSEAYGLVGFFAMLSSWLQLLDVGLSPTLARETAKYRAGALSPSEYAQLLVSTERLFLSVGVLAAGLIFGLSRPIAGHWLHLDTLRPEVAARAVALMGLVFALRWQATLSRSVLVGLERQVGVNVVNATFATLRSAGVLAVLHWVSATPGAFFIYQAVVGVCELAVLRLGVRRCLGPAAAQKARFSLAALRRVAGFSLTIAATSTLWIGVTQLDNLLLSKFLPLSQYAWFTVAVMAASGINLLAGPIGQAVQPRLTFFLSERNVSAFKATYSDATQLLSAVALTTSALVAVAARPLLWAWTGNVDLANHAAPVLAFYAIGNGMAAVIAMTYYLQIAHGDLSLHLKGISVFGALLVPTVVAATVSHGMIGAALAWAGGNLIFFLIWTAVIHRRFMRGGHIRWLWAGVGVPGVFGCIVAQLLWLVNWTSLSRLSTAVVLGAVGLLSVLVALLTTRVARVSIAAWLAPQLREGDPVAASVQASDGRNDS